MKFGVREICDVVFKAKNKMKVGDKIFYENEPVIYFDSLKTSTLEGAATTVYAQGGKGNTRLIAWEGERTVTFTMEDALISPIGFAILSGANVIGATTEATIKQHTTEITNKVVKTESEVTITLEEIPYHDSGKEYIYVMVLNANQEPITEPYCKGITVDDKVITIPYDDGTNVLDPFSNECTVLVDYYIERTSGAKQIDITPDSFGGNFYVEASTLFRTTSGKDLPAEFIIPNAKVQSNFTFSMASTGDPSTFTFTMDAFPDVTRFDNTKKVLAAIQIIENAESDDSALTRVKTPADKEN